jgi:RimJ/RimL family protein N-acetyltransferase
MDYGIAPRWRGRGLASRAAGLAARWLVTQPGGEVVELRIGAAHRASARVTVNAGFRPAGTMRQVVAATGHVYDDLRFTIAAR